MRIIGSKEGIEAGTHLDVDKHAGGPPQPTYIQSARAISANYKKMLLRQYFSRKE